MGSYTHAGACSDVLEIQCAQKLMRSGSLSTTRLRAEKMAAVNFEINHI